MARNEFVPAHVYWPVMVTEELKRLENTMERTASSLVVSATRSRRKIRQSNRCHARQRNCHDGCGPHEAEQILSGAFYSDGARPGAGTRGQRHMTHQGCPGHACLRLAERGFWLRPAGVFSSFFVEFLHKRLMHLRCRAWPEMLIPTCAAIL